MCRKVVRHLSPIFLGSHVSAQRFLTVCVFVCNVINGENTSDQIICLPICFVSHLGCCHRNVTEKLYSHSSLRKLECSFFLCRACSCAILHTGEKKTLSPFLALFPTFIYPSFIHALIWSICDLLLLCFGTKSTADESYPLKDKIGVPNLLLAALVYTCLFQMHIPLTVSVESNLPENLQANLPANLLLELS